MLLCEVMNTSEYCITFKAQVHSKNNLLSIEPEKSDKPIKKSLSKIG